MRVLFRKCLIAAFFSASSFALPAAAFADSFGAIAYSPNTGANGWSFNFSSRRAAENEAQSNCNAGDCRVAIWFKNGCGAVAAASDGSWGSGWAGNRRGAQRQALNSCGQYANSCRIVRWQCSGAN